ncbi:cation transport protein-domain-containing protein [Coniella lustricola]|uniref:Cation transport protein-domain-containing protein n=1 Tax=Coniella lustricola TaxID=2025994 RepID=A0A2T3A559_9PEZI|nr:cation transport protein-domain-containing protein [Coniella lustricola]
MESPRVTGLKTRYYRLKDKMADFGSSIRPYLPPVNFITMHHAYFILIGLIFAVIFWAASHPSRSVSFIDSLFLVESAFTSSGLNTVNLSQLAVGQQVILALMMVLGSPVLISLFTIWFRAHIFEQRFEDIVEMERNRRFQTLGAIMGMTGSMFGAPVMSAFGKGRGRNPLRGAFAPPPLYNPAVVPRANTLVHTQRAEEDALQLGGGGGGGREKAAYSQASTRRRPMSRNSARLGTDGGATAGGGVGGDDFDFKTFIRAKKKSIGRNGQFFDLTDEEREYLGGVEYRSLRILFAIVAFYFVAFQVLGCIALGAWMSTNSAARAAAEANGQNPWWTGIFLAISSFNNAGMTLLDAGITAYTNGAFVLTIVTILALAGNYAFPAFFACGRVLHELCVEYPRRLYMMMFPARANWIFVAICSTLGVVNWTMILVLNIGNSVLDAFPVGQRVGLSLFQSLTSGLYFDVLVLWVYEERSLGIYVSNDDSDASDPDNNSSLDQLMSPTMGLSRPMSISEVSQAATHFSTRSIKKLSAVGRRGTAFIGKQIQRRVNNFQGVGVAPAASKPHLRRAQVISFDANRELKLGAPAAAVEQGGGQVSLVTQHLRSQLSHDIWCIALAFFAITIVETLHTLQDPQTYRVFSFLFEIVSGYTNIGLSLGVPDDSYSFAGGWYTGSKFIMVVMMIRGRHRGLPVALDHAVKLPGWDNAKKQQEDAEIRQSMSRNRGGFDDVDAV